jgi:hypothetical protein
MSIYKSPNPILIRNITSGKSSNTNYYVTNPINNNNQTQVNNDGSGVTINNGSVQDNTITDNSTGFITGSGNNLSGTGNIIGGTGSNIQGNNNISTTSGSLITGDNNAVLGGSNNVINNDGNVSINNTGLVADSEGTTFIGGNEIYFTTPPQNLIHILYGVENNFNYMKQIEIVDGGKDTVRPIYGDDITHIVDGNATIISYV